MSGILVKSYSYLRVNVSNKRAHDILRLSSLVSLF